MVDFPESAKTAPFQSKKLAFLPWHQRCFDERQAGVLEGFEKIEVDLNPIIVPA
jgi:hypothetical protein